MQHGDIAGVAEGAEQGAFARGGVGEHGQGFLGVTGQDHRVEAFDDPPSVGHPSAAAFDPADRGDGGVQPHLVAIGRGETLDVNAAAALHGAPDRPSDQLQQAMVFEEADEGHGRIISDRLHAGRPDRRRLGQQVIVLEGAAIALGVQIFAEGHRPVVEPPEIGGGGMIEAPQVAQHRPEAWAEQVARPPEERRQARAAIFHLGVVERHGEGHVGRQGRNLQVSEQRRQVRIGEFVVDDEAGVHRRGGARHLDIHRVAVAAESPAGLVENHVMPLRQKPRRR